MTQSTPGELADRVRGVLQERLRAHRVVITDETKRHHGHPGAAHDGTHLRAQVVSPLFCGHSLIDRHRMVYAALKDLMTGIHALALETLTPDEAQDSLVVKKSARFHGWTCPEGAVGAVRVEQSERSPREAGSAAPACPQNFMRTTSTLTRRLSSRSK